MLAITEKEKIQSALAAVLRAVSVKTTVQILSCVLLEATEEKLILTGNDMEICIESNIPSTNKEEGSIAVNGKIFYDIIRKMPEGIIMIKSDDNYNVTVCGGKTILDIKGHDSGQFSKMPNVNETKNIINISKYTLKNSINRTVFAVSTTETGKPLSGELIHIKDNEFRLVAIDGYRIAFIREKIKNLNEEAKFIIPARTMIEISRMIEFETDKFIEINYGKKFIVFKFDGTTVLSRLIEGKYFNYENLLKHDYETKIIINKSDFISSIERCLLLDLESDSRPLILDISEDKMLASYNSANGSLEDEIDIILSGKPIKLAFKPRFLMESIKAIEEEELTMYILNKTTPASFKDDEEKYCHIILPVHFVNND